MTVLFTLDGQRVGVLGLRSRGDGRARAPCLREHEVPGRSVEPRQRVVRRDVVEPPPGDGHRLGRDPFRVPASSPPRVGRDGSELGEHIPEARLGGLAIEVDAHAQYCRKANQALQADRVPGNLFEGTSSFQAHKEARNAEGT